MPPIWDPQEDQAALYKSVHEHSSGVISYTLRTPQTEMDPDSEVSRRLRELREAVRHNGVPESSEHQ